MRVVVCSDNVVVSSPLPAPRSVAFAISGSFPSCGRPTTSASAHALHAATSHYRVRSKSPSMGHKSTPRSSRRFYSVDRTRVASQTRQGRREGVRSLSWQSTPHWEAPPFGVRCVANGSWSQHPLHPHPLHRRGYHHRRHRCSAAPPRRPPRAQAPTSLASSTRVASIGRSIRTVDLAVTLVVVQGVASVALGCTRRCHAKCDRSHSRPSRRPSPQRRRVQATS